MFVSCVVVVGVQAQEQGRRDHGHEHEAHRYERHGQVPREQHEHGLQGVRPDGSLRGAYSGTGQMYSMVKQTTAVWPPPVGIIQAA